MPNEDNPHYVILFCVGVVSGQRWGQFSSGFGSFPVLGSFFHSAFSCPEQSGRSHLCRLNRVKLAPTEGGLGGLLTSIPCNVCRDLWVHTGPFLKWSSQGFLQFATDWSRVIVIWLWRYFTDVWRMVGLLNSKCPFQTSVKWELYDVFERTKSSS